MELCQYPEVGKTRFYEVEAIEIPQPYEEVRPLVLRANAGDKVVVSFSHSLDRDLSIHVQRVERTGEKRGFPKDSAAGGGQHWKHL